MDSLGDKYIALHRIGIELSPLLSFGIGEMVVYSNRSVDAAYLNPVIFFESVQRSRKDRDNTFLVFDAAATLYDGIQLRGTLLYDDINFKTFGTHSWDNRWGAQMGALVIDPLTINNSDIRFEYTRIEPYVFSHGRSYDNYYGVDSFQLGIPLQPNSEQFFCSFNYYISSEWNVSASFALTRHGANVDSGNGHYRNVGGNFLQPHRIHDATIVRFLDGRLEETKAITVATTYEFIREFYLDLQFRYEKDSFEEYDVRTALRVDF